MIEALAGFHPIVQALLATLFTWGVTALGAGLVFFTRKVDQRLLDSMSRPGGGGARGPAAPALRPRLRRRSRCS